MRYRDKLKQLGIKFSRKNEREVLMIPENFFRIRILPKGKRLESGCLIWTGKAQSSGYGVIRYGSKTILIHRLAAVVYKIIPSLNDPQLICHNCNTPLCFDEEHLRADNQKGNLQQMYAEGRDRNQFSKG